MVVVATSGSPLVRSREGDQRRSSRRLVAGIVAGTAGLAALALVTLVAGAANRDAKLLSRAQAPQISDADAAKFGAGDNGANWDQGWLNSFVKGDGERAGRGRAVQQQKHKAVGSDKAEEMDQIHSLLNKAVTMMGDLDHTKQGSVAKRAPRTSLPEAEEGPAPGFELNRESKERIAKYEQFKTQAGLPACFKLNKFTDQEKVRALQRMSQAADNLKLTYPGWSKGVTIPGKGQDGEWRHDRGPPYVKRITMFAGAGVDTVGNGNMVRRVLGLTTAFQKVCDLRSCDHAMTGNQYIKNFDGAQFRFLYRNACSTIVIPPLTKGAGPVLGDNGLFRMHHYMKDGYNTMVVCGSTASILFINQNVATLDGGFQLEPAWVDGPYEAQSAQMANTPFAALAATMPGPGIGVTGVHTSSLPPNAISYYEAEDVSVIFEIPMGQGRIIYLGYDYAEPVTPWVHALVAATMFNDYDFKGPPGVTASSSVGRLAQTSE